MSRRKHHYLWLSVLAFLCLASCRRPAPRGAKELVAVGTYVHQPSGRRFPEQVGRFRRERILQYDADGRDVSIGYNLEELTRLIAATVYVYPLANRPFEMEIQDVQEAHDSSLLVFTRDVTLERGEYKLACRLARITYEEVFAFSYGPVNSYLLVCDDAPWRLKWRVTHRLGAGDEVIELLKGLATELTVVGWRSAG